MSKKQNKLTGQIIFLLFIVVLFLSKSLLYAFITAIGVPLLIWLFARLIGKYKKQNPDQDNALPAQSEIHEQQVKIQLPYQKTNYFLSDSERIFYDLLCDILKNTVYVVFSKTRVSDILYVPDNTEDSTGYLEKIKDELVTFLVLESKHLSPCFAIALDDATPDEPDIVEKHRFINAAFSNANIPLLRIAACDSYDEAQIKNRIAQILINKS